MKVFKHTIVVTVLSTEKSFDEQMGNKNWNLEDVHNVIDSGDCIGNFKHTNVVEISAGLEDELKELGNDGSFFDALASGEDNEDPWQLVVNFKKPPSKEIIEKLNALMKAEGKVDGTEVVYDLENEIVGYSISPTIEKHPDFKKLLEDVTVSGPE